MTILAISRARRLAWVPTTLLGFAAALGLLFDLSGVPARAADEAKITVKVDQPGVKISPMLYGLMTEEINYSYDGGLYAELIRNRAFKDRDTPVHWSVVQSEGAEGKIELDSKDPLNTTALTKSLRLEISKVGEGGRVGVANDGYWGIPVKPNTTYRASFYAKANSDFKGPLTVDLENSDGKIAATTTVSQITTDWKRYDATLKTGDVAESSKNRFVISGANPGTIWFSLVSLFPPTFHDRADGNRIDLMNLLQEMHPAFLRFPGGNYVEGNDFANRYNWKITVGPLEDRPGHMSPWNYRSSDGMGLLEFLDWCEDLHMQPVLAVFAGFCLQGRYVATGEELKPFVQDALDEIEYVTGDASTFWGSKRASHGHPAPFKLTYVEVGNEDNLGGGGRTYEERFAAFYDAIKAKYPQLQIIATTPVHNRKPDVVDDHFYRSAKAMEHDAHHYDASRISRTGPKIFVGEWATREGNPTPNMNAALGDSAWMTGMERNSDLVVIAAYAPLFVNVSQLTPPPDDRRGASMQWPTDLIGYNALSSYGSPSYYAQVMFSQNRGDTVLPVEISTAAKPDMTPPEPHGAVGVATWNTSSEFKDIKVVGSDDKTLYESDFSNSAEGWRPTRGSNWSVNDGAYRQTAIRENCRSVTGDSSWTDYTLTLQARKISGREGFLIMVHAADNDNYVWWNIGGWNNTSSALEAIEDGASSEISPHAQVMVEPNRWYNIKMEVKGRNIKCYLDDKLVSEGTQPPPAPPTNLFATASRDDASGDVILKLVNISAEPCSAKLNFQGAKNVVSQASLETLSGSPGDVNSIDHPTKVVPKKSSLDHAAASFTQEFPAHSVNVLRVKTQ
ncbi:MAG TPA: alpha-L-arabinofuranosidase C-terminal domain-containing protein [Pirellulales bacterium]|jgi:alpha-L-arabinofuranosidase|nr:alpha-L-arabinofuranosidase C-terminal domain-containing protein [Pirellulales bacterium]